MMKILVKVSAKMFAFLFFATMVFSQQHSKKIDSLMSQYAKFEQFNGTILVAEKNRIIYQKAFGTAKFEDKLPNKLETKFRVGSMSKPFTATLIFQLIAEKKLSLDDSIGKHISGFSPEISEKVKIRHLLNHTSGIPDFYRLPDWQRAMFNPETSLSDFVKLAYSMPLDFSPGEKFSYCNVNYLILGVILEKVLNLPYEKILENNLLKPNNLLNTGISFDTSKIPNHAFGYQRNRFFEFEPEAMVNITVSQPAGGIYSTVEDLFKFAQSFFNGKMLPPEVVKQMTTPQMNEGDKTYPDRQYAFGWHVDSVKIGKSQKFKIIEHGGSINGFQSLLTYLPEKQITVIFLVNTDYIFEFEIRSKIVEILNNQTPKLRTQSYCQFFIQKIKKNGFTNAINTLPKNDKSKFYTSENEFNRLGYHYLRKDLLKEAIAIFKMTVNFFPNSPNVYNSLGEAFEKNNEIDLALENYQKAVDLALKNNDSDIETYRESLKKLLDRKN